MRSLRLAPVAVAIMTAALHGRAGRQQAPSVPDFTEARQLILDGMARDSVPGLAIAVYRDGSPLWEEGFGWADREGRVRATANTPFLLASLTKTFVATATMALYERHRVDIDRPANEYLRTSALWSPAWDADGATLRRLLNHTSGLSTYNLYCPAPPPTCRMPPADEIIRRYGVIVWPPGERFDYSNLGYYVLGEAIARAEGRELGQVLRDEVFRPLGMRHSSFGVDPALAQQTAISYGSGGRRFVLEVPHAGADKPHLSAAASGYASAHDLGLFGALHTKSRRPAERVVLSPATIDTMQFAVVADGDSRYALGWWIDEDRFGYRSVVAQGGNDHAAAWLRLIPSERLVVAVVANKGTGFLREVSDAALAGLLPSFAQRRDSARAQQRRATDRTGSKPAVRPAEVDSVFLGAWNGKVRTVDGNVQFELTVADSGEVHGTIGSRGVTGRARSHAPSLRLTFPGDLESSDSTRQLDFYLTARDQGVNGTVTTGPGRASGLDGLVSYWVELAKR